MPRCLLCCIYKLNTQPLECLTRRKKHDRKKNLYLPVPCFTHTQALVLPSKSPQPWGAGNGSSCLRKLFTHLQSSSYGWEVAYVIVTPHSNNRLISSGVVERANSSPDVPAGPALWLNVSWGWGIWRKVLELLLRKKFLCFIPCSKGSSEPCSCTPGKDNFMDLKKRHDENLPMPKALQRTIIAYVLDLENRAWDAVRAHNVGLVYCNLCKNKTQNYPFSHCVHPIRNTKAKSQSPPNLFKNTFVPF